MYTHRQDAVEHAAEVRKAGEKLAKEMNKGRPDRNVISVTSVVEQALTDGEKRSVEWQADMREHFDE
jgi:hypothetical protein